MTSVTDPFSIINGHFIQFLQDLFSTDEEFTYSADPTQSKIKICDFFSYSRQDLEKSAVITIQRGSITGKPLGIGRMSSIGPRTGAKEGIYTLEGSVAVSCKAKGGIVANKIASKSFGAIMALYEYIQNYGYISITAVTASEEVPTYQSSEDPIVEVNIQVVYLMSIKWKRTIRADAVTQLEVRIENKADKKIVFEEIIPIAKP